MAVYWIGANGNTYLKGANGVQDLGRSNHGFTDGGFESDTLQQSVGATRIPDPNKPTSQAPPNPNGASSGPQYPALNQGAVHNTQLAIDQLPALLQAALAAEDQTYSNTVGGFNAQQQQQQGQHDTGTTTNMQNYDANFMDSIRAGIKGLGGLMALLRGTGASGGTADQQVRDTVGGVTSNDIRAGADTQKENQTQLDTSLSSFLTDLGLKRKQNEDIHVNNARSISRDSNSQMQDLYGKMAGFYGDAGMTGQRDDFMGRAGALTPQIGMDSRAQVSPYDQTPVVVHAPNLTAFAEPTQPNVVADSPNGQVGSGIFTMTAPRKKETQALAPALAGA